MRDSQLQHGQHLGHNAIIFVVRLHRRQQCHEDQLATLHVCAMPMVIVVHIAGEVLHQLCALRLLWVLRVRHLETVHIRHDTGMDAGHVPIGVDAVEPGVGRFWSGWEQQHRQQQQQKQQLFKKMMSSFWLPHNGSGHSATARPDVCSLKDFKEEAEYFPIIFNFSSYFLATAVVIRFCFWIFNKVFANLF